MTYAITNPKRYAAKKLTHVSIHGDNIQILFKGGGCIESWGEHGANDFAEYGITLQPNG